MLQETTILEIDFTYNNIISLPTCTNRVCTNLQFLGNHLIAKYSEEHTRKQRDILNSRSRSRKLKKLVNLIYNPTSWIYLKSNEELLLNYICNYLMKQRKASNSDNVRCPVTFSTNQPSLFHISILHALSPEGIYLFRILQSPTSLPKPNANLLLFKLEKFPVAKSFSTETDINIGHLYWEHTEFRKNY